jgi:hypothetical protein
MRTAYPQEPPPDESAGQNCETGCGLIANERNRYYTGKFMAARDFQDEQSYHRSKAMLHNRALHGWGVVCGLEVERHPDHRQHLDTECARRWVVVHPGFALDCCGHELVVHEKLYFELPLPEPEHDTDDERESPKQQAKERREALSGPFLLGIAYDETLKEYAPALYAEGASGSTAIEANRVLEGVRLVTVPLDEVQGDCWGALAGREDAPCRTDCGGESGAEESGITTCLEPACPCGAMVPLALIISHDDADHDEDDRLEIHMRGRRNLPTSPDLLTHVVYTSWRHGSEMTLAELREMKGRLTIRFDRKLLHHEGARTGVSPYTYMVQYGGVQRDLEFLPFDRRYPPGLDEENECVATFTIEPSLLDDSDDDEDNIAGNVVYITLKCDFILDCHHTPVDGNHLRGQLPSGDGVPGGVFESWFRVVPSNRNKEKPRW